MKQVTLKDIAKAAGVSVMAVSYAMRNSSHVSEKKREHIYKIAEDLGYKPDIAAQKLAGKRGQKETTIRESIACLIGHPDYAKVDPLENLRSYQEIHTGLKLRAADLGFAIDTFYAYAPEHRGKRLERILKHRGIRGIALLGIDEKEVSLNWNQFAAAYVNLKGRLRESVLDMATIQYSTCSYMAAKESFSKDYTRIGMIASENDMRGASVELYSGLCWAQHDHAIPQRDRLSLLTYSSQHDPKAKQAILSWMQSQKPQVVLGRLAKKSLVYDWLKHGFSINKMPAKILELDDPQGIGHPGIQVPWKAMGMAAIDLIFLRLSNTEEAKEKRVPKHWSISPYWQGSLK